jgi:hypothetical protein
MVTTDQGEVPYWIAWGDGDLWWLARFEDGFVVVPSSLTPPPGGSS